MFTVVNKKASIFKRKKQSRSYFIKEDIENYYYNVSFYVDMQSILKSPLKGFAVYATKFDSENSYATTNSIFEKLNLDSDNAVAALINYERAEITNHIFESNNIPRTYITLIDPKINFDKFRYKNNRHGTDIEKFGFELTKVSDLVSINTDSLVDTIQNSEKSMGPQPGVIRSINRRVVSEGLRNGHGLISLMSYHEMKSRSRLDSHVITIEEQEDKEYGKRRKIISDDADIKSQFESGIVKNGFEEKVSLRKNSRKIMKLNTIVKIPKKSLENASISLDKFSLAFEAVDLTGVITLDTNILEVRLERDKKYSKLSLKKIQIKSGKSTTGEKSFLVSTDQNDTMKINFHHKCLVANAPLMSNMFYPAGQSQLSRSRRSHELQLTRKVKTYPTNRVSCFVPPVLSSTQVLRVTPAIGGVSFDNCFEAAVSGDVTQKANTVPFYVLEDANNSPSGQQRNAIVVHLEQIDPDIVKVRPVKKDVGRSPHASSRRYRPISDSFGGFGGYQAVEGKNRVVFYDYDVEDGNTYDYRLEIVRKPKNASRTYSSNNFIEKYEKRDGSVNLEITNAAASENNVTLSIKATVSPDFRTSAFGLISALEQSLGSQSRDISLFEQELQEIKDSSSVAIVLIAERINNTTGQVTFLGNVTGNQVSDGSYSFMITDNPTSESDYENLALADHGYTYKFTPCSATIAETISAIQAELQTRSGTQITKKLDMYRFADIKKTLQNISTRVLSDVSNKFSRSQRRHVLVDVETQSARNNGQILASASTGDILYYNTGRLGTESNTTTSTAGMKAFRRGNILYYPCLKETKQSINKFNNSKMSHKFIVEFNAVFNHDIDHAVIFSFNNNKLNYECTIHPDHAKKEYRALIEKETFASYSLGSVSFFMFCVKNTGKVLQPQILGNYSI